MPITFLSSFLFADDGLKYSEMIQSVMMCFIFSQIARRV